MRSIIVNGYVYPSVDLGVLESALSSLTYLSVFSYGISAEGTLIPLDDSELIELARRYHVGTLMVLSALTESGEFDSQRASDLFANEALQDKIIDEILQVLAEKGMVGVDFDFEYVFADSRDEYVAFMAKTTERLNAEGYTVTAAIAPKISDDQPGNLYQGHDYEGIGKAVNYVMLMTYEWGYTYGPPMAVAPITGVKQVLEYALTKIPPEKILLGIPNYGYDWPLPFVEGETKARSLGNLEAIRIAENIGAEIQFDPVSQSPFFEYVDRSGTPHVIWFEDERSIRAKLSLIDEYGLAGAGYWNLMRVFPANWAILNSMYTVTKVI